MTEIVWLNYLIYFAAGVTAAVTLWQKALKPIVHGIGTLESALPVLLEIAGEFKHDDKPGSESLKDILTRMEAGLKENTAAVTIVKSRQEDQGAKLEELHEYAHQSRHETLNEIQKFKLTDEVLAKKIDGLVEKSEQRRHDDPQWPQE